METYKSGEQAGGKFAGTVFAEEFAFYLAVPRGPVAVWEYSTIQYNTYKTTQCNTVQLGCTVVLDTPSTSDWTLFGKRVIEDVIN